MTKEILENFSRQYIQSQPETMEELHFGWQGGEPTLSGLAFFQEAIEIQKKYLRPGLRILNTLQTNGTLLDDEWGKFLHEESFLVGLSIDGPQRIHDRYRKDNHEKGSFESVMKGLEILNKHNVQFNTLTVVHKLSGDQPQKIYEFLKSTGTKHMQFIPVVLRNASGLVTPESVGPKQWGKFLKEIFFHWSESDIGEIFIQLFEIYLGLFMGIPSSLCIHAETCGRAVALEHNGDLFACDHYVFQDYYLGNITARSISDMIDGSFQIKFGRDKKTRLPIYCKNCNYLKLCNGGCPAHRFSKAPGGEVGLNYLCEGFRFFFSHSLPYFRAIAACIHSRRPAQEYKSYLNYNFKQNSLKISRNAPCPCGSGKKFKTCCGY